MRTTIDFDDPILKEIKQLQRREGKSSGRAPASKQEFLWIAKPMGARVDLGDTRALLDSMAAAPPARQDGSMS
jgi:hypothetical protein